MSKEQLSKRTILKIVNIAAATEQDSKNKIDFSVSYALLRSAAKLAVASKIISRKRTEILGEDYDKQYQKTQTEAQKEAIGLDEIKDAVKFGNINVTTSQKVRELDERYKTQIKELNEYLDTVEEVEIYECKIDSMEELNDLPNYIRPAIVHLISIRPP